MVGCPMCERITAAFHPQVQVFPPASAGLQCSALVRALRQAFREHNHHLVRSTFANLEALLQSHDHAVHNQGMECLEALQDSAAWDLPEADACLAFMGPLARRLWSALDAIRCDLADASVLEAEVALWRVAHRG